MVSREIRAEILRLYHAEGWAIGTIALYFQIHHSVVERVLREEGVQKPRKTRPRKVDPFLPLILEKLKHYPRLPASVLFRLCRKKGYKGSERQFRHWVNQMRPRRAAEAYLRLRTLPGEQAQADWGHFGEIPVEGGARKLYAFVLVLSYSRAIFLRFFPTVETMAFLRGHHEAFSFFGGVPYTILYDNLKSCVLERKGDAIRYHPLMMEFSAHCRYKPVPVGKGRGNEKGRVERAIRYIRSSFFMGRKWKDLADLNAQALEWCRGDAMERTWPEDKDLTVGEAFEKEKEKLLPLPETPFPLFERKEVSVGKTPYVRFDRNDYSVPHDRVRRTLVVWATEEEVRIMDGEEEVARHKRCWGKGRQIEDPAHIEDLVHWKRRARKGRGMDRLYRAAPSSRELLALLAERGQNLGAATRSLLKLLEREGAQALEEAIQEALKAGTPHPTSVAFLLERKRRESSEKPILPVQLPDDPKVRDLTVNHPPLEVYDEIQNAEDPEEEEEKENSAGEEREEGEQDG